MATVTFYRRMLLKHRGIVWVMKTERVSRTSRWQHFLELLKHSRTLGNVEEWIGTFTNCPLQPFVIHYWDPLFIFPQNIPSRTALLCCDWLVGEDGVGCHHWLQLEKMQKIDGFCHFRSLLSHWCNHFSDHFGFNQDFVAVKRGWNVTCQSWRHLELGGTLRFSCVLFLYSGRMWRGFSHVSGFHVH